MKTSEVVHARIDALTAGLSHAVQETGGARFALMLSMISESQTLAHKLGDESEKIDLPDPLSGRSQLYDAEVVGRLNQSLKEGNWGDLHLMLSWLETVPLQGRQLQPLPNNDEEGMAFSQAAVLAKHYGMVDEVKQSRLSVAA
ncbi:MAG: hypothetical protein OQK12_11565 [Motiliproteus sp.]|nr:hypothetical protein [Motiliproteus sp.]MCW9052145.1 hypothetical protein [Motiliproteus sp.]